MPGACCPRDSRSRCKLPAGRSSAAEAQRRQRAGRVPGEADFDFGDGVTLRLVRIPAGEFVMGDADGEEDEQPATPVTIAHDFWIGACEITNEQFRRFDPGHFSGYFTKRSLSADGPGITMNDPRQPAVRVSWERRHGVLPLAFAARLAWRSRCPPKPNGNTPAARARPARLNYGELDADFSAHANLADAAISRLYTVTGGVPVMLDILSDTRYDDGGIATAGVASYQPNAWGLYDMHGNAAEWTRSTYRPYPYRDDDGRNADSPDGRKVVRGGSFYDRPQRCRSAFRLSYPGVAAGTQCWLPGGRRRGKPATLTSPHSRDQWSPLPPGGDCPNFCSRRPEKWACPLRHAS